MLTSVFRSAVAVASVATAISLPAAALAQTRSFDIPVQSASSGIREFARQAGIQVIATSSDTDGRTTNAVKGDLDRRAAFDQLLSGSGLTVRSFDGKVLILGAQSERTAEEAAGAEEIVVTGSRIARPELESVMPISVTKFDQVSQIGRLDAYDALRLDPAIAPGTGAYSAYTLEGDDSGSLGTAFINLRNLGANRSLTLIDGRRRVSATAAASSVNINMIPPAMIDRIEVVTGGAAAIYGADAVTGAVNIVTKNDLEGLNLTAYQGISEKGDAPETNVSLATGGKFADGRGSFSIGGTYLKFGNVLARDRKFASKDMLFVANPENTGPNDGIPDNVLYDDIIYFYNSEFPMIYLESNNGYYHMYNGQLIQSFYDIPLGTAYGEGELAAGSGMSEPRVADNWYSRGGLRGAEETVSAIAKYDYDFTDAIRYSGRLDYGRTESSGVPVPYREDSRQLWASGHGGPKAFLDNPYMPDSLRSLMIGFGLESAPVDRWYGNWPTSDTLHDRETITIGQSLTGKLGASIQWEAFYQYGRSRDVDTVTNSPLVDPWVAARDVIADPVTGAPVCRDEAARAAGCVPYNIFGNDPLTDAQIAWMITDVSARTVTKQEMFGASVNGKLFALPYGDVSFAAGVERRTDSAQMTGDPRVDSRQVPVDGYTVGRLRASVESASLEVTEAYGELVVPILRDIPFVNRLQLEAAYRYSDYNAIGSTDTWKAGASWEPFDGLTIRGVRSSSVRVPNFGELYEPITSGITGTPDDPCGATAVNLTPTRAANCMALGIPADLDANGPVETIITGGGNPNLNPETSDSFTVGAVLQPRFIRGLDLTVDYWDIKITDAVSSLDSGTIIDQCVDLPSVDNIFCPLIERRADHRIAHVTTQLLNVSRLDARGIDLGVNHQLPLWSGHLNVGFKGSYLLQRTIQTIPGYPASLVNYAGGYADPRFRGFLLTSYTTDHYQVSLGTQFISSATIFPNATPEEYSENHVPSKVYNDIAISRKFDEGFDITLGIKNIFDSEPARLPRVLVGGGGRYDIIGRYFFAKVGVNF